MVNTGEKKKLVFDVAKPGKTPANASSRPIIVTHHPIIKDSVVVGDTDKKDETPAVDATSSQQSAHISNYAGKIIKPMETSDDSVSIEDTSAVSTESNESSKEDTEISAPQTNDTDESPEARVAEETSQKEAEEKSASKEAKEAEERDVRLQKLVEEKKYFVNVSENHRQNGTKPIAVILLLLFLVVCGVYFAIDADIIKTDLKLPYSVFNSQ
ncbi:hypothetical protein HY003_03030 [Candidatus Saccharibacteria bacterium]|nr:hypothetical protein [Candidatus Saccharibacteria bacterium]MBI3338248.1 hypothetical protein [Candidatus Saccharibacteria bacterium]